MAIHVKRIISIGVGVVSAVLLSLSVSVWYMMQPKELDLPLPESLISLDSNVGQDLLNRSQYKTDHEPLWAHFQQQELISYCGVASSVIVLNTLGLAAEQEGFFTDDASDVANRWEVTFGGMTLVTLKGLLEAHGSTVEKKHGSELSLDAFRKAVQGNLGQSGDYILVNYHREGLAQEGSGHISPVSAYDEKSDRMLILDVASYKYPPVWVGTEMLFEALQGIDSDSDLPRGFLSVSLN